MLLTTCRRYWGWPLQEAVSSCEAAWDRKAKVVVLDLGWVSVSPGTRKPRLREVVWGLSLCVLTEYPRQFCWPPGLEDSSPEVTVASLGWKLISWSREDWRVGRQWLVKGLHRDSRKLAF